MSLSRSKIILPDKNIQLGYLNFIVEVNLEASMDNLEDSRTFPVQKIMPIIKTLNI